jgi:hypothetical protein
MYNQQYQTTGTSQYQGLQKQWQPSGTVQSFYGQPQQTQQYGTYPSSESYHTANYRGHQPGHDASLRGDSFQPAQQQQGWGAQAGIQSAGTNYGSSFRYGVRGNEQTFGAQNNVSQQFGFGNPYGTVRSSVSPSFGQSTYGQSTYGQSAESFHAANYRGHQPGHDASLRGDSFQPAQQQSFGQSIESYHAANYRGNQPGHDASLRGDSFQPAQHQGFGAGTTMGMQSGFQSGAADYSSARYGIRGHEQAFGSQNNVSQQFGFNNAY